MSQMPKRYVGSRSALFSGELNEHMTSSAILFTFVLSAETRIASLTMHSVVLALRLFISRQCNPTSRTLLAHLQCPAPPALRPSAPRVMDTDRAFMNRFEEIPFPEQRFQSKSDIPTQNRIGQLEPGDPLP